MGLPIITSWKKVSGEKSIDIHLVEKLEANINKIKKENINVNFYKKIPKKWKGDIIFFAVKPQDFKNVAEEINSNNYIINLSHLSQSVYIVNVMIDNKIERFKLQIN